MKIERLIENVYKYVDARLELFKYDSEERIVRMTSLFLKVAFVTVVLSIFFLFINLTLAFYLNEYYQHAYIGFLIVAIAHLLLLFFALMLQKWMAYSFKVWIRNLLRKIVHRIFSEKG